MDAIELSLFSSRIISICEEMGAILKRAAFSPNIKDRLDYSCAIFDPKGELVAQAAHIPVHLGSMAYAMRDIVANFAWQSGDMVILNDPFLGGTHLPDVTIIAPVFSATQCVAFVANRAHHADIGASIPGSMPVSKNLHEEGMIIPPTYLYRCGALDVKLLQSLINNTRNHNQTNGDLHAQISANQNGITGFKRLLQTLGAAQYFQGVQCLHDYGERLAAAALAHIPNGEYGFTDWMDDDGFGHQLIPIVVKITVTDDQMVVDFSGTHGQVMGNINCPIAVTAAAVYYVFRCLLPADTPACAGIFRRISIIAPPGSLINAKRPAAVAAGNVETSTRIVDVVLGALATALPDMIPAASHGSMNNLAMGNSNPNNNWDYYETIGGGMGAGSCGGGLDGIQTHMTNTLNTPIESLEMNFPVRVTRYELRDNSGGKGKVAGGDGLMREFEFLQPANVTLLTERRLKSPWGLAGGSDGAKGENIFNGKTIPGKISISVVSGDRLLICTPGGGGWGYPSGRMNS